MSVGYITHKYEVDDKTSPPTHRAVDWEPHEVSVVPIPADPAAGFRALPTRKRNAMTESQTALATAENVVETRANPAETKFDEGFVARAVRDGIAREQARRDGISEVARKLGLPAEFGDTHVRADTTLAEFRSLAIDEASKQERARPLDATNPGFYAPAYARSAGSREMTPSERVGRLLRAVAGGKKLGVSPVDYARNQWGDELTARTLSAGIAASGGFLVPEQLYPEVIDLLRPRTVVRKRARNVLPMESGNLQVPRINTAPVKRRWWPTVLPSSRRSPCVATAWQYCRNGWCRRIWRRGGWCGYWPTIASPHKGFMRCTRIPGICR